VSWCAIAGAAGPGAFSGWLLTLPVALTTIVMDEGVVAGLA